MKPADEWQELTNILSNLIAKYACVLSGMSVHKMYDKIEETEEHLIEARAKKQAIDADRITRDNILGILMNFEKLYSVMSDIEKRDLMATMIADIRVYPQRQPNGQWLKSIHFKLPLIAEEELQFSLDKNDWLENVMGLAKL